MRTTDSISMKKNFAIFAAIFCITYLQNRYIGFYHDDYGYASLTYAIGTQYADRSLASIIDYLSRHYMEWGGRVLFFFFEIVLMQGGMACFFLAQALVLAALLFTSYKLLLLLLGRKEDSLSLLACFLSFCLLFNEGMYRGGLFWATASVLYVWPFCPLALGLLILLSSRERDRLSLPARAALPVTFFMAAASQEQVAFVAVCMVPLFCLFLFRGELGRLKYRLLAAQGAAMAGILFLMLAPGNMRRMESGHDGRGGLADILPTTGWIFDSIFASPVGIIWLVSLPLVLWLCRRTPRRRLLPFLPFFLASLLSVGIFYVVKLNYGAPRVFFPASYLLAITFAGLWQLAGEELALPRRWKTLLAGLLLTFALSYHGIAVVHGYYVNYPIILANDRDLRAAGQRTPPPAEVVFYRLPDKKYAECMPYDGREYIEPWILAYYHLPPETRIIYRDAPPPGQDATQAGDRQD